MSEQPFHKRFVYRCWQFVKAVNPQLDSVAWEKACNSADPRLQQLLNTLGKAEKAHTLRVLQYINNDNGISVEQKKELSEFALIHDIGKAITRPSLAFKVAKVLFKLNGNAHCIAGARAVWHLTKNKQMALRVLHHHKKAAAEAFITAFQKYDDMA